MSGQPARERALLTAILYAGTRTPDCRTHTSARIANCMSHAEGIITAVDEYEEENGA